MGKNTKMHHLGTYIWNFMCYLINQLILLKNINNCIIKY